MKRFILFLAAVVLCKMSAQAGTLTAISLPASVTVSSTSSGFAGSVTLTIPAPSTNSPYSTGYLNYITYLHIDAISNGAAAGATLFTCTTTNMQGMVFNFVPAVSTGTVATFDREFASPIISTGSAANTIVCPSNANLRWNLVGGYFQSN